MLLKKKWVFQALKKIERIREPFSYVFFEQGPKFVQQYLVSGASRHQVFSDEAEAN